jgi:hypothetical protein
MARKRNSPEQIIRLKELSEAVKDLNFKENIIKVA